MNSMAQILIYNLRLPVLQTKPPTVQTSPVVLVAVPATGTLEIHTISAGTVEIVGAVEIAGAVEITGTEEIAGTGINHTVQMPAWSSLPPLAVNEGRYRVIMRYDDGETEEKWVDVKKSSTVKLMFTYRPPERLNTLGVSVGMGGGYPVLFGFDGTIQATIAPGDGGFFELGMDIGGGFLQDSYFSLHPFLRLAAFVPFGKGSGWYAGAGVGFFYATYRWEYSTHTTFTVNVSTGFVFKGGFTLSLCGFFGFLSINGSERAGGGKLAVGYSYRFKEK